MKLKEFFSQNNKKKISVCPESYKRENRATDMKPGFIVNTRNRENKALKSLSKSLSSEDNLGIDTDLHEKWVEHQMVPTSDELVESKNRSC